MNSFDVHLLLWVVALALHLIFGILAIRQKSENGGNRKLGALLVAGAASVMSLVTLLVVIRVFVFGDTSSTAQFAHLMGGEEGMSLWSFWFHIYGALLVGNLLAFAVSHVALFFPPYPPTHWLSSASRVFAVGAAWVAISMLSHLVPDA
jgi:hypothetical protein